MARKKYRDKDRSCALCKPHKRNWEVRWVAKEAQALELAEEEIRQALLEPQDKEEHHVSE